MKNILLLAFVALCFNFAQAQVEITIDPVPATASAILDEPSTNPIDVAAKAKITNNSTETKTFMWTRVVVEKPDQWASGVCDKNFCYSFATDSEEFELEPGEAGTLDVHIYPSGSLQTLNGAVPGTGVIQIVVVEVGNEDNTATGEYQFTVDATMTSLTNLEITALQLFPNPATSSFGLKGPQGVEFVKIYNLLGTEIRNYAHSAGAEYDVSALPKGMYLVALLDEDAQLLKTVRLQRQ